MKKLLLVGIFFSACASTFLTVPLYADTDKNVAFDLHQSSLTWVGKKVTGEHTGIVKLKSAEGKISSDGTVSGNFEIDMQSIAVSDIEDPKYNKKLQNHLGSDDFFSVSGFPVVSFVITKSEAISNAKPAEANMLIAGNLSIKGITHPVSFPAHVSVKDGKVTANGIATVNRLKYDIKYNSGSFFQGLGDKLIYDDFTVELKLVGSL